MYGVIVIGAPGAGKSTFCAGILDIFHQMKRNCLAINLDPANDNVDYEIDIDVKELITVQEVMERLSLGPNGALKYCIDTLCANESWLTEKLMTNRDKYFVIDCPGQLELYKGEAEMWKLMKSIEECGIRLCALHLADSLYCSDAAKFVSVVMSTLACMITLEMPHVNVLSKIDLFDPNCSFDLDFFTRLPDMQRLLELLDVADGLQKYHKLNEAICQIVSDFDLVSFVPLDVTKKEHMANIIKLIDTANGYSLIEEDELRNLIMKRT